MTIKEARRIVSEIKNISYEKRIKILSRQDWDFINTLSSWFKKYPAWQEVSLYWAKRLTEINKQKELL